jgi:uncharacterized protein with FMN-binding domain
MSATATATNDERLVGKLLVSTALVVISAGYGYWQKARDVPRAIVHIAATPSPMPAKAATAPGVIANNAAPADTVAPATAAVPASAAAPADAAAPVARTALADKPAAPKEAAAAVPVAAASVDEGAAATAITMADGLHLEDGEYISQHEDFEWGTVQVKVVIKSGAFTDIQFLQMPDHRPHSEELSDLSKPILSHEAIHDQKSAVDLVTTATYTSMAYQDAMANVIMQATRQ